MQTRTIGSLEVSTIGLGCNNLGSRIDDETSRLVVEAALQEGITFFDTADRYGQGASEEALGRVLHHRRDSVVIASKFGLAMGSPPQSGARPEYIRSALEGSLVRLRTDYIDLYQLHLPDPEVPIEETMEALLELKVDGKVREIGFSNFDLAQLEFASNTENGKHLAAVQNQYSLLHREPEEGVLDFCFAKGIAFIPYFPLASGVLTGKYTPGAEPPTSTRLAQPSRFRDRFFDPDALTAAKHLQEFARSRGRTLIDLAFSWLLRNPTVSTVIAGASSAEQVTRNATATIWELSAAELARVDEIMAGIKRSW